MGHRARDDEVNGCDRPLDCWAHASSDGRIGGGGGGRTAADASGCERGVGVGGGPAAHVVDAEVIVVHVDAKEAAFTPVRAPRISANPILQAGGVNTPAYDGDNVVAHEGPGDKLRENAASVGDELICGVNSTCNGAVLEKFSFHFVDGADESAGSIARAAAVDKSVAVEAPLGEVRDGRAHALARAVVRAVFADAVGLAIAIHRLVVLTRFLWKTVLLHIVEHNTRVATAAASFTAIQNDLNCQNDIWALRFARYFDAIREGGGSADGPAAAAILGNVLVAGLGEVVYATDVAPEVLRGKIGNSHGFVGPGVGDFLAILEGYGGGRACLERVDVRGVAQGEGRG